MPRSLKQIKKTTMSIKSTRKTTRTMQLISVSRLQKVLKVVPGLNAYVSELKSIFAEVSSLTTTQTIWNTPNPEEADLLIVFSADRGLCGGFNAELIKQAKIFMGSQKHKIICVGKKTASLGRLEYVDLVSIFPALGKQINSSHLTPLLQEIKTLLSTKQVNRVSICYTSYINSVKQTVVIEPLFSAPTSEVNNNPPLIEPNKTVVYQTLLEQSIMYTLYRALVESSASEQHARMAAMKQATDSAGDIIDALTLEYNKSRQQSITQEIAQIVSAS